MSWYWNIIFHKNNHSRTIVLIQGATFTKSTECKLFTKVEVAQKKTSKGEECMFYCQWPIVH